MEALQNLAIKAQIAVENAVENGAKAVSKELEDSNLFAAGNWDINNVFKNTGELLRTIGSGVMVIIGIAMIIVGIVKIAQGLISHGKTQVNWVINILLILVGALFCAGAAFFRNTLTTENGIGANIANELENLGK